jgi:hypothetical protein
MTLLTAFDTQDIHIDDIAEAFILLAEEALKPHGGSASWGAEGYYFAEAGEFVGFSNYDYVHSKCASVALELTPVTTDLVLGSKDNHVSGLFTRTPALQRCRQALRC